MSTSATKTNARPHDKGIAAQFLANLDPSAERFTFQFLGDVPHGTADIVDSALAIDEDLRAGRALTPITINTQPRINRSAVS